MNSYFFYRRIRGPVFLLTFGVTALLAEWDVLSFARSWPLYLIVFGVLRLAEGAAFTAAAAPPPAYPAPGYSGAGYGAPPAAPGTGLAPIPPAPLQSTGYEPLPDPTNRTNPERES